MSIDAEIDGLDCACCFAGLPSTSAVQCCWECQVLPSLLGMVCNVLCNSWMNGHGMRVGVRYNRDHHTRGHIGTGRRCTHAIGRWGRRELTASRVLVGADHSELHSLDLRKVGRPHYRSCCPQAPQKRASATAFFYGVAKVRLSVHAAEAFTRGCILFCICSDRERCWIKNRAPPEKPTKKASSIRTLLCCSQVHHNMLDPLHGRQLPR
jgi:hypothetical protein